MPLNQTIKGSQTLPRDRGGNDWALASVQIHSRVTLRDLCFRIYFARAFTVRVVFGNAWVFQMFQAFGSIKAVKR